MPPEARRRRPKLRIVRFRAGPKAHSLRWALAPVAALRFLGRSGPPIAPLLFSGSLYPPPAALRRETLPTEPAAQPLAALPPYGCGVPLAGTSLGFGGGPVFTYVTGAAAPRAARIGIAPQALMIVALYRLGPPGRRRCHAAEIPWCLWRLGNGAPGSSRPTQGRTYVCARSEPRGRYNVSPLGRKAACRTARGKFQEGGIAIPPSWSI